MGSFVENPPYGLADPSAPYAQINETIRYTREYADGLRVVLSESIEELTNIVGGYNPDIEDVDTTITPIDQPIFPDAPVLPPYESTCILDNLITKICSGVLNGGTGITTVVYNNIILREQEARRTNQDREYQAALNAVGVTGFNLASGQVAAMQTQLTIERIAKDQDALNNLAIKDFDLATENTRFMITSGMELEKILQTIWDSAAGRTVDVYKANVDGVAAKYRALTEWVRAEIERINIEATIAIENGKLGLDAYTASVGLAEKVSSDIANIAAQAIASALGAINTSLSNGYSGSESVSENISHSEGISESHNYEES